MKKIFMHIKVIIVFIMILPPSAISYAVTAYPDPIQYKQPDGSVITIMLKGDERVHWAETMDKYTILSNKDGAYEYAIIDERGDLGFSGIIVHNQNERSHTERSFLKTLNKQLRFSSSQMLNSSHKCNFLFLQI